MRRWIIRQDDVQKFGHNLIGQLLTRMKDRNKARSSCFPMSFDYD